MTYHSKFRRSMDPRPAPKRDSNLVVDSTMNALLAHKIRQVKGDPNHDRGIVTVYAEAKPRLMRLDTGVRFTVMGEYEFQ